MLCCGDAGPEIGFEASASSDDRFGRLRGLTKPPWLRCIVSPYSPPPYLQIGAPSADLRLQRLASLCIQLVIHVTPLYAWWICGISQDRRCAMAGEYSHRRSTLPNEVRVSSISIEVNGVGIATISLAGMDVVDVSVFGGLDREQKAMLSAMGGNYSEGGCGHLIWIAERGLLPGELLSVRLNETCGIATPGKTIAELYPEAEASTRSDFSVSADMAAEIRARPRLHEGFKVQVETSRAQQACARSDELNTCFTFGILWDRFRPDQLCVRLASYCLDDVVARTGGNAHLETTLSMGDSVSFSVLE